MASTTALAFVAPASDIAAHTPEIARSIFKVRMDLVDWTEGLRPLDMGWVEALQALMTHDGQRRPIELYEKADGRFGIIAGRHRWTAAQALGWPTIEADILSANGLELRAAEVSENLHKLDLSPLDRAAFVAEQIAIEKARAGLAEDANLKSVVATARWADRIGAEADDASAKIALAYGFTEQVAEKVGLSRRAIYLDLEIHRGIRPDVAEQIRALPVAQNASQLRALAKLPGFEQREVASLIVAGTAKGVTDALGTLKQAPVKSVEQKAVSAILGNWGRLSARQQKELLKTLALPKGVSLTIDGEAVGGAE
ncbi:ParB/RepB/Spo0J family partition protein [Brevundimonas sp.]|uniref:ParB/RepB/Spo0J family partition protein n=1 Tax=Brevundimonas sp. TaxID=1871086 RepID=UPI003F72B035